MQANNQPGSESGMQFADVYDQHFDAVNRYLRYRVENPWDADDLTAAVFLKVLENWHRFRGEAPWAVWIFRIAHNLYIDYLRGRQGKVFSPKELHHLGGGGSGPEEKMLQGEEAQRLRAMLAQLAPEQRDVISLRYAGELKYGQIAAVLNKSEPAVRMIHHRALKALRAEYQKDSEGR
ncbi:MAG: RNA polymerase sigma factor [Bacillota bacterium]|jgi:RNA polymerase sigma-70 factor (ECF subfamily)